jgi:hypothetical protein
VAKPSPKESGTFQHVNPVPPFRRVSKKTALPEIVWVGRSSRPALEAGRVRRASTC